MLMSSENHPSPSAEHSRVMPKATLSLIVELGAPCGAHVSAVRGELRGSVQSGSWNGSVKWNKVRVGDELTGGH